MMPPQKTLRVVVDRIDNKLAVLVDDANRAYNVSAAILRRGCRAEGAVLDAPIDDDGKPRWGDAKRNWDEERRRLKAAEKQLDKLRATDSGGDVEL
ncbi:MAG TPA: DUF3006 family protein [Gemmatimonadaceae bacterium]|nr:DUF3006 family protein [Gemmatimonadaceae bacterium]